MANAEGRDRARGALLGLACGDAVGTTLEFERPGTFTPIDDIVGGGPFHLRPGQWTDDTSMALCLAESLLDRQGMDPTDQLRRYVLWSEHGYLSSNGRCFDIGITTRTQLARFKSTSEAFDPDIDEESAANGSLMRLAPVPIRWQADPATAAEQAAVSSRTTHPATRPVDTCRVLAAMTAALIGGAPFDSVFDARFWSWGQLHQSVESITRGSWRDKEPPAIRGTGFCIDAIEAAIWAVAGADDFRSAVLRAANLGDDADTTAAIAGQLAGARFGESGIPSEWLDKLALRDRIGSLADNLYFAELDDQQVRPWAFDAAIHAWWVQPLVLAGEYPGSEAGDRTAQKLALLVDAGVRTFVDLTTLDDRLAPYAGQLASIAEQRSLDLKRVEFPIPDLNVVDRPAYEAIVAFIEAETAAGRAVFVHCWGGVGRTGTVVGCLLIRGGLTADNALDRINELRRGTHKARRPSPETAGQRQAIRDFGS